MAREALIAAVLAIEEQDQAEYEELIMTSCRLAAAEIMELEEGPGFDELVGEGWDPVSVSLDEYHNNKCFKLYSRMNRETFLLLVEEVQATLVSKGRLKRERTPLPDIMLMVLWLIATPDSFRSVALRFGVTPGTLYYFYSYIIESLREMAERFIVWLSAEERQEIKEAWEAASGFPGVIGSIDCTHVFITAPLEHAANYRNRHDSCSITVQVVVDHNLLVREIHAGEVGSMNDKRVLRRSKVHRTLLRRGEGRIIEMDEHLLGDGGYTLTDFMMIPFANNGHLTAEQLNYNRRLSQTRVRVENSFALAKGKWRSFKFLYARNPSIVVDHITACFVIHNFLIRNGEPMIDADDLRRLIQDDEVLGNMNANEDPDDPQDIYDYFREFKDADNLRVLFEEAQVRGEEKRIFIMNNL